MFLNVIVYFFHPFLALMSQVKVAGHAEPLLSVSWVGPASAEGKVRMLDQRDLPLKIAYIECSTVAEVYDAIYTMTIRGAPAIGAAGGYGMALAAFVAVAEGAESGADVLAKLREAKKYLDASRPTAVNLEWATARLVELAEVLHSKVPSAQALAALVLAEAEDLAAEDVRINRALGDFGAAVVPQGANIIHHCNTGALATVGHGTAIGVIYSAHEQGKGVHVWVDETRPRLQGAKLTAFELAHAGVPLHLVVDGAAGHLMYENKVDIVLFGADRVAANGDVANKIGTMKLAVCAHEFKVPVFACVPTPTIDLGIKTGREIVIEERTGTEVTHIGDEQVAPTGCPVYNPAFDVTPFKYLTGIVTEVGICYPPFEVSLKDAKEKAEAAVRERWAQKLDAIVAKTE
jgi:methylthioribose-1-phosphate isomerase